MLYLLLLIGVALAAVGVNVLRRPRVERAIAAANQNARNYHLRGLRRRVAHGGLAAISATAPQVFLRRLDWLYGHDVTA